MKPPQEILPIVGLAAMALMLAIPIRARSSMLAMPARAQSSMFAIPTRARSSESREGIPPCDSLINDKNSSVDATKQAQVLIAWIVKQTHWTFHKTPPIRLVTSEEIQKRFTAKDPTGFHLEAFYSEQDHAIYLPDSWHPNTLRDRSILLHKLVHHFQYLNHIQVTCESEYEFQALKLQAAWLSEHTVEYPLDLMGVDLRYVLMLSHCPEF